MTIVIGLLGPAGAGKSTVAAHLAAKYGAKIYTLAAPLKEIARRVLDFSQEQLYGTQAQKEAVDPRYGFSCRWFLQRLGTEGCRAVLGDNIWTEACLRQITYDNPYVAVIEDVRFVNEADLITQDGGVVWRLRPPEDEISLARAVGAGTHASETQWLEAEADYEIAPTMRGIPALLALADDVARQCRLFPKRPELPL